MNVKCTQCGIAHNCDFCPNCGADSMLAKQKERKSLSAGGIILLVFLSIFGVMIFVFLVFSAVIMKVPKINNRLSAVMNDNKVGMGVNTNVGDTITYFELSQGDYKVGEDIPAATYDITGVSGWGFLWIYKSEELYENDISTNVISLYDGKTEGLSSIYTTEYKNLKLKEGQYIKIQNTIVVGFDAN